MNRQSISGFLFLLILLGISACGGSTDSAVGNSYLKRVGMTPFDLDTNIAALNPEVVVQPNEDGTIYIGSLIGVGERQRSSLIGTISELKSFSYILYNEKGKMIDSLYTDDITRSGLGGRATSMMASAGTTWTPPEAAPKSLRVITLIRTESGTWLKEVAATLPEQIATDPIILTLDINEKSEGVEFVMTAKRLQEALVTEHLPTSEMYRFEVYEGPIPVWSTSDGQMFAQVNTPVEPDKVGETTTYKALWNGRQRTGAIKKGTYTVVATIPAKPTPYTIRKEFQWRGN